MIEKYTNGAWAELAGYKKYGEITFDFSSFPASFQSEGANMSDYRIYGANDGVGEQTENLFDKTSAIPDKQYDRNGNLIDPIEAGTWYASGLIEVEPNETYVRSKAGETIGNVVNFYNGNKNFQSRNTPGMGVPFTIPSTTKYISFAINADINPIEQHMLTEGSTAPAQYIPFGYQINAVVQSENLFDKDKTPQEVYVTDAITRYGYSIPVTAGTYCVSGGTTLIFTKTKVNNAYSTAQDTSATRTLTLVVDGYILIYAEQASKFDNVDIMLTEGSTAPTQYISYFRSDTPIYIGDTPLAQGEYVDYGEQKVYKYVGGELTPTDLPVALPALPTIDGATIVDFDNTPKPSRMTGETIGWKTMTPKIYENGAWT